MTPPRSRAASVALLTTVLVLTGCAKNDPPVAPSDSAPSTSPTSAPANTEGSAPANTGTSTESSRGSGTGAGATTAAGGPVAGRNATFTVTPPEGWGVATDQAGTKIQGLDLVLLSPKKVAGFSNNLVVIVTRGDAATVEQELTRGRSQLAADGREIGDAEEVQIAGVTAKGFRSTFEQKGVEITARSYAMHRDGKVYLLTLSSSQQDQADALNEFATITSSWAWT